METYDNSLIASQRFLQLYIVTGKPTNSKTDGLLAYLLVLTIFYSINNKEWWVLIVIICWRFRSAYYEQCKGMDFYIVASHSDKIYFIYFNFYYLHFYLCSNHLKSVFILFVFESRNKRK